MTNSNATVLRWNTSLNMAEYWRGYELGGRLGCLPVEGNQVPPFQLPRAQTGDALTVFKLVYFSTGAETDILAEIIAAGLEVKTFPIYGYDLIVYPSNAAIVTSPALATGAYYAVMSDGTTTWYSELFWMVGNVTEGYVKIEWCHNENFFYPGGHVDYTENYKNYLYVRTDVLSPSYEYSEEVTERDGYTFPEKQISWKLFRMNAFLSEAIIDAVRLIRLHDKVTITNGNDGRVYTVDEFLLTDVEWVNLAHLAHTTLEFKTDTVVVINGRATIDADCGGALSPCLAFTYSVVATIVNGSAEYLGEYYTDADTLATVAFAEGDYILIETSSGSGVFNLNQYLSGAYSAVASSAEGTVAYDHNGEKYYWQNINPSGNTWLRPFVSAYLNKDKSGAVTTPIRYWTAFGDSMPGVSVEIFTFDADGNEVLAGVGTHTDFAGLGIEFAWSPDMVGIRAKVSTDTCKRFDTSADVLFEGVNYWIIEDDNIVQ